MLFQLGDVVVDAVILGEGKGTAVSLLAHVDVNPEDWFWNVCDDIGTNSVIRVFPNNIRQSSQDLDPDPDICAMFTPLMISILSQTPFRHFTWRLKFSKITL